jgi:hypothetical protein
MKTGYKCFETVELWQLGKQPSPPVIIITAFTDGLGGA